MDDAALLHLPTNVGSMVMTLDVITPIVDDPIAFGRIAAANALSDVYAMGGRPQVALSFAGLPGDMGLSLFEDVLRGMAEKAAEAGCAIVGGHTIKDTEPKCGLVVIGEVSREDAWTHKGASVGQALVLTKPIGTGVLAQALRAKALQEADIADAVASMQTLNDKARDVGRQFGATAATDVTGFGLLGHLHHMAKDSGLCARLHSAKVPLLPGARDAASAGHIPGGTKRNAAYVAAYLSHTDALDDTALMLLADAQTSGGLLLSLPKERAQEAADALPHAAIIGAWEEGEAGHIILD